MLQRAQATFHTLGHEQGPGDQSDALVPSASIDWSFFDFELPEQRNGVTELDSCDTPPATVPVMPPSRHSSDSSNGGWSQPTTSTIRPPPPQAHQPAGIPTPPDLAAAWAATQAQRARLSSAAVGRQSKEMTPPQDSTAVASTASRSSSAVAAEMSWSLPRGLSQPIAASQMAVPEEPSRDGAAGMSGVLLASHPLGGQLAETYPSIHQFVSHTPEPPPLFACGRNTASPLAHVLQPSASACGGAARAPPPPSSFSSAHMSVPQHAFYNRVLSLNPTAVLKQLTEDELRRRVQQQVMTLIAGESDPVQVAWLHELLEISKTSALPVLGTLRQQLDVLLQPLPSAAPPQAPALCLPSPAAALSMKVEPIDWQAAFGTARGEASAHQRDGGYGDRLQPGSYEGRGDGKREVGGSTTPRSLSSLPASFQRASKPGFSGSGGGVQPPVRSLSSVPTSACHAGQGRSSGGAAVPPTAELVACGHGKRTTGTASGESEKRAKAEGGDGPGGGAPPAADPRWWRRQNNFTLTIDDIVKKMQSQGCPGAIVTKPAQPSSQRGSADGGCRHINADRVRQVYHKPLKDAAKSLSVSVMSLKRTCRKMGVSRWPYRKLASLSELELTVREDLLEQQLPTADKEAVMQYIEAEKAAIMVEPDRDVDPLLLDLRKAKIHMKYEKWGRRTLAGGCRGSGDAAQEMVSGPVDMSLLWADADAGDVL